MLSHAATLLLSVGDIMGFNSPEQFTSHSPLPVDGGERKFDCILVWKQRRFIVDLFQSLVLGLGGCIECWKFSLGFLELSVIGRERSFWTGTPSFVGHIEGVQPEIRQRKKKM